MTATRTVELDGHIIDSGMMQRAFGLVMDLGGDFEVEEFVVGKHKDKTSHCRMAVTAGPDEDDADLQEILHELHQIGANLIDPVDARVVPAPADQVVPHGFYSTTNHPTRVRYEGEWIDVQNIEMDCAIVVEETSTGNQNSSSSGDVVEETDDGVRAYTKVLNAIEEGDLVVTDEAGVRVEPPERPRDASGPFGFMQGGVSSERPSESLIKQVADALEETKAQGGKVLVVAGPALIHAGAGDDLARLVREGYVDMISAGNGFATHDVERGLYGTSLGMDMETMEHPRKGHKHHIYTISEVIRAGGIEEAVEEGLVGSGIMYECVKNDVPYVLAGSIRDDGPLPDTITDAVEAQEAIREQAHEADMVLMLSTLLHSVAVGNCLPSTTRVVCVDINPATVTQLLDRGSSQAIGMVTDIGTFVPTLADEVLTGDSSVTDGGEDADADAADD
ncbi:LOR/SDH bifunctional protein [Halogeometricum pallidum JCM 14848]|uniref:Ornithine cyclodeaminase n=1 Tax=Halogeometricum pallidum JCM 14848 TaxID=1227487 RepID=M0DDF6_HALPD|nr:TIGR00300 family protein [Halogeometricum pallidum]ELZ33491.1 LOR/SDH bifunctional protein [Halogeometricum pallidum JCM 14848]